MMALRFTSFVKRHAPAVISGIGGSAVTLALMEVNHKKNKHWDKPWYTFDEFTDEPLPVREDRGTFRNTEFPAEDMIREYLEPHVEVHREGEPTMCFQGCKTLRLIRKDVYLQKMKNLEDYFRQFDVLDYLQYAKSNGLYETSTVNTCAAKLRENSDKVRKERRRKLEQLSKFFGYS